MNTPIGHRPSRAAAWALTVILPWLAASGASAQVLTPDEVFRQGGSEINEEGTAGALELASFQNATAGRSAGGAAEPDLQSFVTPGFGRPADQELTNNFTAEPIFTQGIVIADENVAMKIGGYVKADLIHDFNAIGSEDFFDTSTIPTSGSQYENTRFHARQSRLNFDTRWRINGDVVRAYIEADFFGGEAEGNTEFRLRHAYGSLGRFTAGQTWTTLTDPSAVPQTLDFEGAVSNVNRRQGLVRWDQPVLIDGLSWAAAIEDPQTVVDDPAQLMGEPRTQSPDFITRLRLERDRGTFQSAFVLRKLGFQQDGLAVASRFAWGFNFTGSFLVLDETKAYYQINFGEGIGSYRGSPDIVVTGANSVAILPMFGWMVGVHHQWNDFLTSNVTYSRLILDDLPGQAPGNLRDTTYFAVNLIANPYEKVFTGIEYLYGVREDVSGASGTAHRLQMSFGFFLP